MGLPFPPPWDPGVRCIFCEDVIFEGVTPIFVYAFAQDIIKCPGAPVLAPDPNRIIRMTQRPGSPCVWEGAYREGAWDYHYLYWFTNVNSYMVIEDVSNMRIFYHIIAAVCQDSFANQWGCGAPDFSAFTAGTVDCFW